MRVLCISLSTVLLAGAVALGAEPAYQADVEKGQDFYAQGRFEEALARFEKAIAAGAKDGEVYYQTAFCYRMARQDVARSREYLNKAAPLLEARVSKDDRKGPGAYYYLSAVRRELGQVEESTTVARKGIDIAEAGGFAGFEDGESLFQIARLYTIVGEKDASIRWYEKAVEAMDSDPEGSKQQHALAFRELATWNNSQGRYHESAGWYMRLLEAEEMPEPERFNAGLIMIRAEQYDEALSTLKGFSNDDLATEANYATRVISRYRSLGTPPPIQEWLQMDEGGLQEATIQAAIRLGEITKKEEEARKAAQEVKAQAAKEELSGQRWPRKAGGKPPTPVIKNTGPAPPPSPERLAAEKEFFGLLAERLRRGLLLRNLALSSGFARLIFG